MGAKGAPGMRCGTGETMGGNIVRSFVRDTELRPRLLCPYNVYS